MLEIRLKQLDRNIAAKGNCFAREWKLKSIHLRKWR